MTSRVLAANGHAMSRVRGCAAVYARDMPFFICGVLVRETQMTMHLRLTDLGSASGPISGGWVNPLAPGGPNRQSRAGHEDSLHGLRSIEDCELLADLNHATASTVGDRRVTELTIARSDHCHAVVLRFLS